MVPESTDCVAIFTSWSATLSSGVQIVMGKGSEYQKHWDYQPTLLSNETYHVVHAFLFMRLNSKLILVPFVVGSTSSYHLILKRYCNLYCLLLSPTGKIFSHAKEACNLIPWHWTPISVHCLKISKCQKYTPVEETWSVANFLGRNKSQGPHLQNRASIVSCTTIQFQFISKASIFDNQVERFDRPSLQAYTNMNPITA